MIRTVIAFVKKDFLLATSYKATFVIQFLIIFFSVAMFYYVGDVFGDIASPLLESHGNNYFAFLLIGVSFLDYHVVSLSLFSKSIQESQMMGTLEIILVSPIRLSSMLLCSSLWGYIFTSIRFLVYLLFAVLIFGLNISNSNIMGALLVLVFSIICFTSFGIVLAGIVMVLKRSDSINAIVSSVFMFLGGVIYPVEVLPDWISQISYYIPLTHALNGMRKALLQGYPIYKLLPEIMVLTLFSLILLPIGLKFFKFAVHRAKEYGTLTHY